MVTLTITLTGLSTEALVTLAARAAEHKEVGALQTFIAILGAVRQQHPNDCRIAASAMSHGCTVVTRNTRHFAKIPGVNYEDWTLAKTLPTTP